MNQSVRTAKSSLGMEQCKQGTNCLVPILSAFIYIFLQPYLYPKNYNSPGLTKQSRFHMQTDFTPHEIINIGPSLPHLV